MLSFKNVSVSFNQNAIIKNLSLEIPRGETHVLLGASGSGKSTMLRLLVGLVTPTHGTVEIDGSPVTPSLVTKLISRIGYVIQEGGLFPHMTLKQNLLLAAKGHVEEGSINDRIRVLLQTTALDDDLLDRYPHQLSGGQRQRAAVIRALMKDPEILLMDEPLGALDPITRYDLQRELREWFEKLKKTVLFVTHDLAEAFYFGHRITLLEAGTIAQSGKAHDFIHSPKNEYVKKFVSSQRIIETEGESE